MVVPKIPNTEKFRNFLKFVREGSNIGSRIKYRHGIFKGQFMRPMKIYASNVNLCVP